MKEHMQDTMGELMTDRLKTHEKRFTPLFEVPNVFRVVKRGKG